MASHPQFGYAKKPIWLNRILTTVVVTMALLIVLFPVLVRARASIQNRSCASNLRQIGAGMALYGADYDERFPAGVDPSDKAIPQMWAAQPAYAAKIKKLPLLQDVLLPYVENKEAFHCPLDTGGLVMENTFGQSSLTPFITTPSMYAKYGTSYLFRTEIVFRSQAKKGYWPSPRTGVLFDGYGQWHGGSEPLDSVDDFRRQNQNVKSFRYNVLFGDGHVESQDYYETQATWGQRL